MMKASNEHWEIDRDEDGDYHLKLKSMDMFLYVENEEMRSLMEGVYDILAALDVEEHGEIEGVTR